MKITYKTGKQYINTNDLNRLYNKQPTKKERRESTKIFAISIIGLNKEFINKVRIGLYKDQAFAGIMRKLNTLKTKANKAGKELKN